VTPSLVAHAGLLGVFIEALGALAIVLLGLLVWLRSRKGQAEE
jgi:hypothetical protein